MLFPLFPRRPHRFSRPLSSGGLPPINLAPRRAGLGGLRRTGFGLPPRIAETDEWGDLAYFWMADVMEMHSDMTRETGSTATETGRLLYRIRGGVIVKVFVGVGVGQGSLCESPAVGCSSMSDVEYASRFIVSQSLSGLQYRAGFDS